MVESREEVEDGRAYSELLFGKDEETNGEVDRRLVEYETCLREFDVVGIAVTCPAPLTCRMVAGTGASVR